MIPAPFESPIYTVRPEWIDANGHLNLAYYLVLLDWATDALWAEIGLGDVLRATGHATFAAESHVLYRAELTAGETVRVQALVLGADAKRMHIAHEMRRCEDGTLAAMQELMYLCVDLGTRRVASFPAPIAQGLQQAVHAHAGLQRPDWIGRRIAMPSASPA